MIPPKLLSASVEMTNEICYQQGYNAIEIVNRELTRMIASEMFKERIVPVYGVDNPTEQTKTFSTEVYVIPKENLRHIIMSAVNRSHTGMPPLDFL